MKKLTNPWKGLKEYNCFGCAPNNPAGVKMEFFEDGDDIVSLWKPRAEYQGWLNTLHGGIQAVLLDEICAWVVIRKKQTTGVTFKMETKYLKPISTLVDHITIKARLKQEKRHVLFIEAEIYNEIGEVCTQALCTYFTVPQEKAREEYYFTECETEE